MKPWVLTTIITLSIVVTAQGADKLLNEACTSADTCVDISGNSLQLTCDVLVGRCLIKPQYACKGTEDLCMTGAYCKTLGPADVKCVCATDYTETSGLCGPADMKPGDDCSGGSGCITNAVCSDDLCTCDAGFRLDENGECVAVDVHTVGAVCIADPANTKGDCLDKNAECPATSGDRCGCKDGYVGVVGRGCNVVPNKVGGRCKTDTAASRGSCEGDGMCSAITNGVCQCPQGYEGTEGKTACTIMPNKLGGSCTTDTAASKGSCEGDGMCSATTNGVCQCPQDYEGKNGDTVCKVSFNAPCTSCEECADDFAVCDPRISKCLVKAGSSCSGNKGDKCVSNSSCSGSSSCACRSEYAATTAGLCGVALGFSCVSDDDCAHSTSLCDATTSKCLIKAGQSCSAPNTNNCVSNATCTEDDKTCLCNTNFHASNNGLCILQDEKGRAPRESSLSPLLTWFIGLCLALYVV